MTPKEHEAQKMYKIGDKVETPHGTGWVRGYSEVYDMYIVDLKGVFKNQQYKPFHLLPYRTAHEKLIEMGLRLKVTKNYADGVFSHEWWNENDDRVIVFYIDEKVTSVYECNNEIMAIIPQYLEELK